MKTTALIMAGGVGERFWPRSRKSLPKQFLSLTGDGKTMIQNTVARILPLVAYEDIYIVTNASYRALVRQQLPGIPEKNILLEPVGRNTAPCIGLGAVCAMKNYGDATMLVLPSDHIIHQAEVFRSVLTKGIAIAQQNNALVTLGIAPNAPETGYGYVKYDEKCPIGDGYRVESFHEKPDAETARRYLSEGGYLWNSGMFIWKASEILRQMQAYMPENYKLLMEIGTAIGTERQDAVLQEKFPQMQAVSIDYGILERGDGVYVIPASFGWDDVGSWLAVGRMNVPDKDGNTITGDVISVDSHYNIVQGGDKLIAMVGLENIVVVDAGDAILICNKNHTGKIRQVLDELHRCNRDKLL